MTGGNAPASWYLREVLGDDEHAKSSAETGAPYRGTRPRTHLTRVDVGVPDPKRRRAFVAIGFFTLLLVAGVFVGAPNASTAVTLLGIAALIAFAWWVVRRLEGTTKKDLRARIAIDHFALCADIHASPRPREPA